MRALPIGDGIRLADDSGVRAIVRFVRDAPGGAGPVSIATTSGPAFACVPRPHWLPAFLSEALALCLPCLVPCLTPCEPWPWFTLVCTTCDGAGCDSSDRACGHVRAVVDTVPTMQGRSPVDCRRVSALPMRHVGGLVADGGAQACAVCLDPVPAGAALTCHRCSNRFHRTCIEHWIEADAKARCPLCRDPWPAGVRWIPLWALQDSTLHHLLVESARPPSAP